MTSDYEFSGGPAGAEGDAGSGSGAGPGGEHAGPVLLVTLYDPVEAEIIVARLRSAGIDSFSHHDALSTVLGLTVDGAGQQDIFVRPEDLEEARAALEQTP
jgi:hypothetical protein